LVPLKTFRANLDPEFSRIRSKCLIAHATKFKNSLGALILCLQELGSLSSSVSSTTFRAKVKLVYFVISVKPLLTPGACYFFDACKMLQRIIKIRKCIIIGIHLRSG
jgi:hypothetical protein